MNLEDFSYDLPESYIAQEPVEPRDSSRVMVIERDAQKLQHQHFRDLTQYLNAGDVLVMNDTRVIPARLNGYKSDTGGRVEFLLLRRLSDCRWRALVGGKRGEVGMEAAFNDTNITATVVEELSDAERVIEFSDPIDDALTNLGQIPLPPYINSSNGASERYQTVFSRHDGSSAAPTAGLHFTPELLIELRNKGVKLAYITLHIGLGTFQPVKVSRITDHEMHAEYAILTAETAKIINEAKLGGGKVIAVGTTVARTLESAAILSAGGEIANPTASEDLCPWRPVIAFEGETNLFIYPGYKWRVVDSLVTNFHLPGSTLLMLVGSFMGREFMLEAYETAKQEAYRFYSFGDAMFIR